MHCLSLKGDRDWNGNVIYIDIPLDMGSRASDYESVQAALTSRAVIIS